MNWIVITTGIIFLICIVVGIYRGAVKIAVSLAATIVTFVLVFFLTPYVSEGIISMTPLDTMIEDQAVSAISGMFSSGDEENTGSMMTEENIRRALNAAGITEEQLNAAGITIQDIINGNISDEELAEYGISSSLLSGLRSGGEEGESLLEEAEIPKDAQVAAIEGADIPEIFKSLLLTNNNEDIYEKLGADTFVQYIAKAAAKLIINILAFILTFIIITIILRAVIFALDIIANLPVLGLINRLAGGILGAGGALIIVWVLFMFVTFLYTTSFGKEAYTAIQNNGILRVIYEFNPIMKLAVTLR